MGVDAPMSLASRLYALLLYLYPSSFRREYGESMLQLFNDQRRAVSGAGGNAMLWLKTLRDLVLSVPAAYSSERQKDAQRGTATVGAVFVWGLIAVLACAFLAFAVVIPSTVGYLPSSVDEAVPIASAEQAAASRPYRALVVGGIVVVATLLAAAAFLFSLAQRTVSTGAATFVAGAALSIFMLGSNPWIWMRQGEPSIAGLWILAVWPLAAIAWAALMIARRRQRVSGA
jgi:hypothetical protein